MADHPGKTHENGPRNYMTRLELLERAERLRLQRVSFVLATVVRAQSPTSAKPGDTAMILSDGTIEGFVGGGCAQSTVRLISLRALREGRALMLRISPSGESEDMTSDTVEVLNSCLSGGMLEMFLEPNVPPPLVVVAGAGPIAQAIVAGGGPLGFDVRLLSPGDPIPASTDAVVVATHGIDEDPVLRASLAAEVPYIALVASRRRAQSVLETLTLSLEQQETFHSPAGLDIGARTPEEVALSIFAEIVSLRCRNGTTTVTTPEVEEDTVAIDPVCGMSVAKVTSSLSCSLESQTFYFCGTGCLAAFRADPSLYSHSKKA